MREKHLFFILALGMCHFLSSQALGCEVFQLQQPSPGATIADPQPTLEWYAERSDLPTRVQIHSYVPEGGALHSLDVAVTENFFTPPRPLTPAQAGVKIRISRGCPSRGPEELFSQGPAFFVDTAIGCRVPERPEIEHTSDGTLFFWSHIANAKGFEIKQLAANGLPATEVINKPGVTLPTSGKPMLIKIRTLCHEATSEWLSVAVTPSPYHRASID